MRELKIYENIKRNIVLIHGIETGNRPFRGIKDKLIRDLGEEKDERGECVNWVTTIDYGRLLAIHCWTPFMKYLLTDYITARLAVCTYKYPRARKIVIAHSYGTSALNKALLRYREEFRVDGLVFLGSVAKARFPWNNIIEQGYVKNVFCYRALKDWVPWVAQFFGMGASGRKGFREVGQGKVRNVVRKDWGHNSYPQGYEDYRHIIREEYDKVPLKDEE